MAREMVPGWLAALAAPAAPGGDDAALDPAHGPAEEAGRPVRAFSRATDVVEAAIAGIVSCDPGFRGRGTR